MDGHNIINIAHHVRHFITHCKSRGFDDVKMSLTLEFPNTAKMATAYGYLQRSLTEYLINTPKGNYYGPLPKQMTMTVHDVEIIFVAKEI